MKKLLFVLALVPCIAFAQSTPPPNGFLVATDTFVRTNAATLGSNWEENPNATYVWSISTNTAIKSTGQFNADAVYWIGSAIPDNQWASVRIASTSNTNQGAAVRITQGTTASRNNGYAVRCTTRSSLNCTQVIAYKVTNSALTAIITVNSAGISNWTTKYIQISAEGTNPTTVKIYVDGTQIGSDYVDSTDPWTTGKPGMMTGTSSVISAGAGADYFEAGSMGAAAAGPTFNPVAGTFTSAPQSVTISTATSGATICYTTDGSTPAATAGTCTSGSTYSSPVSIGSQYVSGTVTLKAIASKSGMDNSAITSGNYVFQYAATPVISFPTGAYIGQIFPKFTCSTPGSSVYYTTDGSTPTTGSTLFVNVTTPTGVTAVKSGTGGTLLDGEFRYRVTAITATGETLVSSEGTAANLTGTGTNSVTVSWSAVPGATGYKVYGRSATDDGKGYLATVSGQANTTWTDTGADTPANMGWLTSNNPGFPLYDTTGIPTATSGTQTFKALCTKAAYGDSQIATSVFTINPADVQLVYDDFNSYDTTVFQSGTYQIGLPVDQFWTNNRWMHITEKTGNVGANQFKVITVLTRDMCNREGNQCIGTGNGGDGVDTAAANIEASYSADQWASIKVWDAEHHDGGICLRCNTDGNPNETGYKVTAYVTQIGQEEELGGRVTVSKFVNGVETVLCKNDDLYTSFGHAQYWGATLKGRIAGNTLEATINGELIPGCPAVFVDSSPITQGNPGFWSFGAYNSASMLTEFRAGNVGSTPIANSTPLIPNWSYQTYSSASVGGSWAWVPAATDKEFHYREPFNPNGQFEKVTINVNASDPNLDRWAVELKQESWLPGARDGGCDAADMPCVNSIGYYLGARPYNKSIADQGVVTACLATNGEYACKPFAHITKTTHAVGSTNPADANYCGGTYNPAVNLTGCNNIITLASSAITPMQGDEWYGEYVNGTIRAACKRSQTYGSWQATHAYSLNTVIVDGNGNFQRVVVAGTSAGSAPTFATSWAGTQGNRVTDGGVTWEYYGRPCPSTTEFTWVMEVTDNDLVDRVSYPAVSSFGPAVSSTFTNWSAGSATTLTACSLLELCTNEEVPVTWFNFWRNPALPAAATPTFTPSSGAPPQTVSIDSSTSGSGPYIYWNTTGSPTTSDTHSTSASVTTNPTTLYAKVINMPGYSDSAIGSATYSGSSGAAFSDNFDRTDSTDIGANWTEVTGDAAISSNRLRMQTGAWANHWIVYSGTATNTANQYIKFTVADPSNYPQVMFRYTNGSSAFYFLELEYTTNNWNWSYRSAPGGSSTQINASAIDLAGTAQGKTYGVTLCGTGTSTAVRVWENPTGLPTACDNWNGDSTPDGSFTDDPGANAVDSGSYVGLGGQSGTANDVHHDDFFGGDAP
jgi:hypothetical protein